MIDVEPLIRTELERLVPPPVGGRADWGDVVRRAGGRRAVRRPAVLALAAAFAVLATAAALATGLGGFDRWLRGTPGKPAPATEQRRFEAANGRSWAAFPRNTQLRELIRTRAGGESFVLYGFRSGNSLCLRLQAPSLREPEQACAPASALARASTPVFVVVGDRTFSDTRNRPSALVSFGIAADGVARVDVDAVDGRHRAALGGNAYLFVQNEPNTGNRVLRISAVGPTGRRSTIAVADGRDWPWAAAADRRPGGPTKVEARIEQPAIRWHLRGERRGGPGGLVKPDPLSNTAVGLSGNYCLLIAIGGPEQSTSCSSGRSFFARGSMHVVLTGDVSASMGVHGAAADGIRRVRIFLADGTRQEVALRHNLFTALVARAQLPLKIAAYDARGRVVGIVTPPAGIPPPPPAAATGLAPRLRVRGPNGTVALLKVGRPVRGYRCWRVVFSSGQSPGGCFPPVVGGPRTHVSLVQPAGRDLFVVGAAGVRIPRITRVVLELAGGRDVSTRPVAGHFVLAVPRSHLTRTRQVAYLLAYNELGFRAYRQSVVFRVRY